MNTKHTPGPWTIEGGCFGGYDIHADDSGLGDTFTKPASGIARYPDARLIAAAPDMLAALRIVANCMPNDEGGVDLGTYEVGVILDAIAKATGR